MWPELFTALVQTTVEPLLTGTSLQRPLFFCHGGQSIHWLLFKPLYNGNGHWTASLTAKITSRQRPVFSATAKKSGMVAKFDPYGGLVVNPGDLILIVFHLFWCRKYKLSTILVANVESLNRFVMKIFWFKTFFKLFLLCVFVLSLYTIYDWITFIV